MKSLLLAVTVALALPPARASAQEELPLIPIPAQVERGEGAFRIDAATRIAIDAGAPDNVQAAAERWAARVRAAAGVPLPVARGGAAPGTIHLAVDRGLGLDVEGYRLDVAPDRITVRGGGPAAVFYGLQTLRQLLPPELERGQAAPGVAWTVPALRITDEPRFRYRGVHLDVVRHFFPVEFVKAYIDRLALYKFNTFHWHLTDDQGWRIEIPRYPRLTEVGAWRSETMVGKNFDPYIGDGIRYGGFYTQDEVREVVAYAAERFIRVIPEIEMPGHAVAALASYPELACTPGPFDVATRWGVFEDIFCPKEETFTFLENVLTEVLALFPSEYIHIGGDEAPKRRWRESPVAQEVIRRERLANEGELQSWFVRRIERFLRAHGRRLIGWDEILEGGLPPEATVMSWRGMAGGIEAARDGHDVIMTPGSHVYFDHYQGPAESEPLAIGGNSPLPKVYAFEPVPAELSRAQAAHVIGAQANLWTEYIATTEHVEYMLFPRLLALSEVVWSPRAARDWPGFRARLDRELLRLDALGVNYRRPE